VPEHPLNLDDVCAAGEEHRRERVPKGMEPRPRRPDLPHDRFQMPPAEVPRFAILTPPDISIPFCEQHGYVGDGYVPFRRAIEESVRVLEPEPAQQPIGFPPVATFVATPPAEDASVSCAAARKAEYAGCS
jgi:hypothetical protein